MCSSDLLHGFTQTSTSWAEPIAALKQHVPSAEFWVPDMPGHGTGTGLPLPLHDGATALAELSTQGVWIGYSMGGRYLLHIAVQHPAVVEGLVLVSTTAGLDLESERSERSAADDALADTIEQQGVSAFLERWMSLPMFRGLQASEDDLDARQRNSPIGLAESLRQAGTGQQEPLWDALAEINVPTLIVTGAHDTKFCEIGARLHDAIEGSHHEIIANAGHAVHLEQCSTFAEIVADWAHTHFSI